MKFMYFSKKYRYSDILLKNINFIYVIVIVQFYECIYKYSLL